MTAEVPVAEVSWLSAFPHDVLVTILTMSKGKIQKLLSDPTPHESQKELPRDACWLHVADIDEARIRAFLAAKFANYYRKIEDREIDRAIEFAKHAGERKSPAYPPKNEATRAKALAETPGDVVTLRTASRVQDAGLLRSGVVLDFLLPAAKLLCLATAKERSATQGRALFAGFEEQYQFVVPNEMSSEMGLNQAGRLTPRCNANVGPQINQVIEFDDGSLDEQAKLHLHLRQFVPLAAVVFSGSKSLHGWFRVDKIGGERLSRFLHYCAALGADRATYVPCQLVRTPNATREPGGARQETLYLDPEAGK